MLPLMVVLKTNYYTIRIFTFLKLTGSLCLPLLEVVREPLEPLQDPLPSDGTARLHYVIIRIQPSRSPPIDVPTDFGQICI